MTLAQQRMWRRFRNSWLTPWTVAGLVTLGLFIGGAAWLVAG